MRRASVAAAGAVAGAALLIAPGLASAQGAIAKNPAYCPTKAHVLDGVYHAERLVILAACKRAGGTIASVRHEDDGDLHIRLNHDPAFAKREVINGGLYPSGPQNSGPPAGDPSKNAAADCRDHGQPCVGYP